MEKVELKHVGYKVEGKAKISLWGGGQGSVNMTKEYIHGQITKDALLKCINDGGFGCVCIESAELVISDLYEKNFAVFNRNIAVDKRRCEFGLNGI